MVQDFQAKLEEYARLLVEVGLPPHTRKRSCAVGAGKTIAPARDPVTRS